MREQTNTWDPVQGSGPTLSADLSEIPFPSAIPRELLADLFHALNQPLAAVRCSCELALLTPRSAEQYRECLQTAVLKTEQASLLAKGIRELLEAGQEDASASGLSFPEQVREAVEYFSLPAADAGTTLQLDCDDLSGECLVDFRPEDLRRALFYVFDCILPLAAGKKVSICVGTTASQIYLHLSFSRTTGQAADGGPFAAQANHGQQRHWQPKLHWAIAERLFRARRGSLAMNSRAGDLCVQVSLPLAQPDFRVSER